MAKAATWVNTDAHVRKRGEQTGLETPVVHAVNDECSFLALYARDQVNTSNIPPGDYDRKVETQRI